MRSTTRAAQVAGVCLVAALIAARLPVASDTNASQGSVFPPWRTELGGFSSILDIEPLSADNIHAAGSGLIHSDGTWWRDTELPPSAETYRAVSFAGADEGWAGGTGVAVRFRDGEWQEPLVQSNMTIRDIDLVGPGTGWAVGWNAATQEAAIWEQRDDGWEPVGVQGALPRIFESVWMASAVEGWAVGGNSIAHFDGSAWTAEAMGEWGPLHSVDGTGAGDVWVVGGPEPAPFVGPGPAWILHYDGVRWQEVHGNQIGGLADVAVRENEGYTVGFEGAVLRLDGGRWSELGRVLDGSRFNQVRCVAFVPGERFALAAMDDARVYRLEGETATLVRGKGQFSGIGFTDDGAGWVLGPEGAVLHRAGQWLPVSSDSPLQGAHDVSVVANEDAWAVGDGGQILRFDGARWQVVESPVTVTLNRVKMYSHEVGWAVGAQEVNSGSGPAIHSVVLEHSGDSWRTIWDEVREDKLRIYDVDGTSPADVWVAGSHGLWHFDGGRWSEYALESCCRAVAMRSSSDGYAGGERAIYRFDGRSWQVEFVASSQMGVERLLLEPEGVGWAVSNSGSVLRLDGATWRLVSVLPGALAGLAMSGGLGGSTVWVVGGPRSVFRGSREELLGLPPVSPSPPARTAVPFTPIPSETETPTRVASPATPSPASSATADHDTTICLPALYNRHFR